jgi:hypothetical protein
MIETEAEMRRGFPVMTVAVTSLGFALVQLDGSILTLRSHRSVHRSELASTICNGPWTHTSWLSRYCSCPLVH